MGSVWLFKMFLKQFLLLSRLHLFDKQGLYKKKTFVCVETPSQIQYLPLLVTKKMSKPLLLNWWKHRVRTRKGELGCFLKYHEAGRANNLHHSCISLQCVIEECLKTDQTPTKETDLQNEIITKRNCVLLLPRCSEPLNVCQILKTANENNQELSEAQEHGKWEREQETNTVTNMKHGGRSCQRIRSLMSQIPGHLLKDSEA